MSATRDLKNNIAGDLHYYNEILSNGTSSGAILDTADYDSGIMFNFGLVDYGDGTYTITMQESDDSTMATETLIPDEKLIGSASDLVFNSITAQGDSMTTIGIVGTKRYVRARSISSAVTTGATLYIGVNKKHEILPVT